MAGEGFVEAEDLKISDKLLLSSGKRVIIEKLEVETVETAETTYNFEVADFHTYYISESNVLVHNDCVKKWNGKDRVIEEDIVGSGKYGTYEITFDGDIKYIEPAKPKDIVTFVAAQIYILSWRVVSDGYDV